MDAFFASVEQQANPELKGKLIAVVGASHRTVITTAPYEAFNLPPWVIVVQLLLTMTVYRLLIKPPQGGFLFFKKSPPAGLLSHPARIYEANKCNGLLAGKKECRDDTSDTNRA